MNKTRTNRGTSKSRTEDEWRMFSSMYQNSYEQAWSNAIGLSYSDVRTLMSKRGSTLLA
jgi:hypothetical protein